MYVPVGMTVTLDISSDDVAHSWWIPELGGKADALPGYINKTWFRVTEPGIYRGQCAELCGRNHANMYGAVFAMPFDRWKAWYDRQARDIQIAKDLAAAARKRLEAQQGAADRAGRRRQRTESETLRLADSRMAALDYATETVPRPQIERARAGTGASAAGRRGSRPPITRRSGSCTSGRSPSSSSSAASRPC